MSNFPFFQNLPQIIGPYIIGWRDVRGDGNCGFRVLSHYMFGHEDGWVQARNFLANELSTNPLLYHGPYLEGVTQAISRIRWESGPCGRSHWMQFPEDMFAIATMLNAVVVSIGNGTGVGRDFLNQCYTVLPLRSPANTTRPEREIIFGHLGTAFNHYIRLDMTPAFPLPPLAVLWRHWRTDSVRGWDNIYRDRLSAWLDLTGGQL